MSLLLIHIRNFYKYEQHLYSSATAREAEQKMLATAGDLQPLTSLPSFNYNQPMSYPYQGLDSGSPGCERAILWFEYSVRLFGMQFTLKSACIPDSEDDNCVTFYNDSPQKITHVSFLSDCAMAFEPMVKGNNYYQM